jgi:hypothetical protein
VTQRQRTIARATRLVLPVALATVVLTGCGGKTDAGQPDVASVGGAQVTTAPTGGGDLATYVESVRKFGACLREAGFDITDPDSRGRFDVKDKNRAKSDPAFPAAMEKCQGLLTQQPDELRQRPPEEVEQAREYAQCMRDNGAPDYPDPLTTGYWPELDKRDTSMDGPDVDAAAPKCATLQFPDEKAAS